MANTPFVNRYAPTSIGDIIEVEQVDGTKKNFEKIEVVDGILYVMDESYKEHRFPINEVKVKVVRCGMILPQKWKVFFLRGAVGNVCMHGNPGRGKTTIFRILKKRFRLNRQVDARRYNKKEDMMGLETWVSSPTAIIGERKLLIIDDIDATSFEAQSALMPIMENHGDRCMFIITCNDISKIIRSDPSSDQSPVLSRCTVIDFDFSGEDAKEVQQQTLSYMTWIMNQEGFFSTGDDVKTKETFQAINTVIRRCGGDIRSTIHNLDTLSNMHSRARFFTVKDVENVDLTQYDKLFRMIVTKHPLMGTKDRSGVVMSEGIFDLLENEFKGSEKAVINALGTQFISYLIDKDNAEAAMMTSITTHKYEYELRGVTDKFRTLVACVYTLWSIKYKPLV